MRRWPLLVLVLAPLLALWPGLTGLAVGPFDAIRQFAPWNGPKPEAPWDVLMADSVLQSHVWRTLVLDAWGKGQLPLWNPYQFAGTPLLANSQSGGFYPPHIVLGMLHVGAGLAGFVLAWFHLALAGLGTHALVRRLGGSFAGGLTGGLLFSLSPFMLGWTPLSSPLATIAWIPLALACVADRTNSRSWIALASSVGMMFLAGHLQFAAYGIMAILLFALWSHPSSFRQEDDSLALEDVDRERNEEDAGVETSGTSKRDYARRKLSPLPFLTTLAAVVLGAGLAAPQMMPVFSYSKESHRRNVPTEEGYQAYIGSALQPYELANLGHPMALGSPRVASDVEAGGQKISTYWPAVLRRNFAESAISIGAIGLALLLAAPWRKRQTWPLACIGAFSLFLALGTPLNRLFYFLVPGWSSTGSPARVEILFVLAACALAGLAVDRITERKAQLVAGGGLVAALLVAFVLPNLVDAGPAAQLRGAATLGVLPSLLLSLVLAAGAFALAKRSIWAIPAAAVAISILTHATSLVPFGETLKAPAVEPGIRIAVVNDSWDLLTAQPAVLPPNLAALGGVTELSGYDSLTSRDVVEMLRTVNGGTDPAPPANGNLMFVKPTVDMKALASCGVTELWSRKPLPQLGTPVERDGYLAYQIPGAGRVTNGRVIDGYDHQEIIGDKPGDVVLRDRFTLGWTSANDGFDVFPYRDVAVWRLLTYHKASPAQPVHALLRYDPPGLYGGTLFGANAWLALLGLSAACWSRSRRKRL